MAHGFQIPARRPSQGLTRGAARRRYRM
jgi:hypothetical protein